MCIGSESLHDSSTMTYDLREQLRKAVGKGHFETVQKIINNNLDDVDAILTEVII